MTVTQFANPKFDSNLPKDDQANAEHTYLVTKAVNTLKEPIGAYITPQRVRELIYNRVDVAIVPPKQ